MRQFSHRDQDVYIHQHLSGLPIKLNFHAHTGITLGLKKLANFDTV